jgi:hypothetical protein
LKGSPVREGYGAVSLRAAAGRARHAASDLQPVLGPGVGPLPPIPPACQRSWKCFTVQPVYWLSCSRTIWRASSTGTPPVSGKMLCVSQLLRRPFSMLTDPVSLLIPFTYTDSVSRVRSGSFCRLFPPGAESVSHTVALGTTIGESSDPWVGSEWTRPASISRASVCRDRSSQSPERARAV